jgi:hypothetical protein
MSPGCCRDKRPPFPRRCLDECRSSPSLLTEADEIVSTGSSAAATARALEGYAAAPRPGVDGRGPFMPRLRLEGRRRPNPPAPPWFFSRSTVEGLGCCRPTGYPATRSATASARAPSTRSFGTYAHGYPYSAYFVGGEQSEIPIRIGKFCRNVV